MGGFPGKSGGGDSSYQEEKGRDDHSLHRGVRRREETIFFPLTRRKEFIFLEGSKKKGKKKKVFVSLKEEGGRRIHKTNTGGGKKPRIERGRRTLFSLFQRKKGEIPFEGKKRMEGRERAHLFIIKSHKERRRGQDGSPSSTREGKKERVGPKRKKRKISFHGPSRKRDQQFHFGKKN